MLSLECICSESQNEKPVPGDVTGCSEDDTCSIADTSVGQCFLEMITFLNTNVVYKRYKCLEIESSMIDASLALKDLCNHTSVSDTEVIDVGCCTHADYCNNDIVFLNHPTTTTTLAETKSTSTTGGNQSSYCTVYVCI